MKSSKIEIRAGAEGWLQNVIVAGISGALGSVFTNVSNARPVDMWGIAVLCLLATVIAVSIHLMLKLRKDIYEMTIDAEVSTSIHADFKTTEALVSAANEEIVVATSIGTKIDQIRPSNTRSSYMDEITRKIRINPKLRYTRVMPTYKFDEIMTGKIKLSECDFAAASHLRSLSTLVEELAEDDGRGRITDLNIYLAHPMALLPSTVIIDNTYVCFAIPRRVSGLNELTIDSVIIITDRSQVIPRRLKEIILSVGRSGQEITANMGQYI